MGDFLIDILSEIFSLFQDNPFFVLFGIGYLVYSVLKSAGQTKDDGEAHESNGTWEDMERQYGIQIEKKSEEAPEPVMSGSSDVITDLEPSVAYDTGTDHKEVPDTSRTTSKREKKRQTRTNDADAIKQQPVAAAMPDIPVKTRKKPNYGAVREGMKWSIILGKPKALERLYR